MIQILQQLIKDKGYIVERYNRITDVLGIALVSQGEDTFIWILITNYTYIEILDEFKDQVMDELSKGL